MSENVSNVFDGKIGKFGRLTTSVVMIMYITSYMIRAARCWYYGIPMVYKSISIVEIAPIAVGLFFLFLRIGQIFYYFRPLSFDRQLSYIIDPKDRSIDIDKLVYMRSCQMGVLYYLIPFKKRWYEVQKIDYESYIQKAIDNKKFTASEQLKEILDRDINYFILKISMVVTAEFVLLMFLPNYHGFLNGDYIGLYRLLTIMIILFLVLINIYIITRAYAYFKDDVEKISGESKEDGKDIISETIKVYRVSKPFKKDVAVILALGCLLVFCASVFLSEGMLSATKQVYGICRLNSGDLSAPSHDCVIVLEGDDFYVVKPVSIFDKTMFIDTRKYMFVEKYNVDVEKRGFSAVYFSQDIQTSGAE